MIPCPPQELLAALLEEQLPQPQRDSLEAHLSDCLACQRNLLDLSMDPTDQLRWKQTHQPPDVEAPADLIRALKPLPFVVVQRGKLPTVPGYEILGELGRGGMAVVYRARQLVLNRLVALKMILAGRHAAPEIRDRFRREAAAVASLQHPNIVQVYEIGEHEGLPYFSMELVEGGTLQQALWEAMPTAKAVSALVESLAHAVQAAHLAGVVHRDLKPANILLGRHGLQQPKIADFGLVLPLGDEAGWTRSGDVLGTPAYMAPEQAQGRRRDIGPATDIHALGVILYELLTGSRPFDGEDDVATLVQVSYEEAVPPRRLRPTVPRDLETICLKCLRKLPSQRYSSAGELAEDLRRFQAGEPIQARPITRMERLVKWGRRRPLVAGLLGGILLLFVASFTGMTLTLLDAQNARNEEAQQRQKAETARSATEQALARSERSLYIGRIAQARSQWQLDNVRASRQLLDQCDPKWRGWEWAYLQGLNHTDLLTIPDLGAPFVNSLAFSRDGRWLASGGGNPFGWQQSGVVAVFDGQTGAVRWKHSDLSVPVWGVAYSPDGRMLVSSGGHWRSEAKQGELKLWDANTGKHLRDFPTLGVSARGVAFSPDGQRLAIALLDHSVRVCEVATGKEILRIPLNTGAHSVGFSPDGRFLVMGTGDGILIADTTGKVVQRLLRTGSHFALSPDNRWLVASPSTGYSPRVFDLSGLRDGKTEVPLLEVLAGHTSGILSLAFSPDGQSVASASADGTARVWMVGTQRPPTIHRGHLGRVGALAFHPDGRVLASGGQQPGSIKLWDATRPAEHTVALSFGREHADIETLTFSADDQYVVASGLSGVLAKWHTTSGEVVRGSGIYATHNWQVPAVRSVFLDGGRRMAAVSQSDATRIQIWDLTEPPSKIRDFSEHTQPIWHIAADRKGQRIVSTADGKHEGKLQHETKVWETATGKVLWSITTTGEHSLAVALSPDGTLLARSNQVGNSGKPRGELTLRAIGQESEVRILTVPSGSVRALSFSTDGGLLAGATDTGLVVIWNTQTGEPIHDRPLEGASGIDMLAFHPGGTRLAGVDREHVRLWDVESGQVLLFLRGAPQRSSDNGFNPRLAWSHDGTRLAASNWDRTVSVWDSSDLTTPAGRAMLRQQAANRSFSFHIDRLERGGEIHSRWSEEFHRKRIETVEPPSPELRACRAEYFARLRWWDRALADFTVLGKSALLERAILLLQTGNTRGYQQLLSETLTEPMPIDHEGLGRLSRAAMLGPLRKEDLPRAVAVTRALRESSPSHLPALECHGLTLLGVGSLREAREVIQPAWQQQSEPGLAASAACALALVHLRAGDAKLAQPLLDQADAWLQQQAKRLPPPGVVADASWEWQRWLEVQLLRRRVRE